MPELPFLDSFVHLDTAQHSRKWSHSGVTINATSGRGGRPGASLPPLGLNRTFVNEYATLAAGIAIKTPTFANSPLIFSNALTAAAVEISHVGDGRFRFVYNNGTPGTNVSSFVMRANRFYFLELEATMSATGSGPYSVTIDAEMRANEATVLTESFNFSSANAAFGSHANFATVALSGVAGAVICDFYVDIQLHGDNIILLIKPNAAGDLSQFTPNVGGGAQNWQMVDELPADDDTTVNNAASVGLVDLYNLENIGVFTGDITMVQGVATLKKSDEGIASGRIKWKYSGTVVNSPTVFFPSAEEYLCDLDGYRLSPWSSAIFTPAELNGMQIGYERLS